MAAFDNARRFLEGFATREARLTASVIIAIAGVVVAYVILPRVFQRGVGAVSQRLKDADEESYLRVVEESITWSFPTALVTRVLQLLIMLTVTLSILVI